MQNTSQKHLAVSQLWLPRSGPYPLQLGHRKYSMASRPPTLQFLCSPKFSMENPPTYPLNQVATHNVDPQGVKQFITNCRSDDWHDWSLVNWSDSERYQTWQFEKGISNYFIILSLQQVWHQYNGFQEFRRLFTKGFLFRQVLRACMGVANAWTEGRKR